METKHSNKISEPKTFTFQAESSAPEMVVRIPEVLHPSYGMYVWPSAVVLAQFVWQNRDKMVGHDVLELGAGTALPGIVAAKCGARVTLTDSAWSPESVKNCRLSCEANGLDKDVSVLAMTWGNLCQDTLSFSTLSYVLASDCFYDTNDFDDILATVSLLLERNNGCKFWCTYQVRSCNWTIEDLLAKWELKCKTIPLVSFGADDGSIAGSNLPGRHTIQMLEITSTTTSNIDT